MQPEQSQKPSRLSSAEIKNLQKIFYAEHKPKHDQKWDDFARAYPEIARISLIQADLMRGSNLDRGDVYLRAAADIFTALNRIQTIKALDHFTDKLDISPQTHKHTMKDLDTCEVCSNLTD